MIALSTPVPKQRCADGRHGRRRPVGRGRGLRTGSRPSSSWIPPRRPIPGFELARVARLPARAVTAKLCRNRARPHGSAKSPRNSSSRCQGPGPRVSLCGRDARPWTSLRLHVSAVAEAARMVVRGRRDRLGLQVLGRSSAAPGFPNPEPRPARPDDGAWRHQDGRTRPGQASVVLSLRPRDAAPRLHYAFSARTVCGRVPVSTRFLTLPPKLHVFSPPWGGAPRPPQARPGDPTARKRGVPPLSIDPTTADVTAIHRLAAGDETAGASVTAPAGRP